MAETAPLTTAFVHARTAVRETAQSHWSQASTEHQHASSDYSRAARTTSDGEALRILRLLETEHAKLASLLAQKDSPQVTSPTLSEKREDVESAIGDKKPTSPPRARTSTALRGIGSKEQRRESSPSLARDMASRRGIPPQINRGIPSAAAQARAIHMSPEAARRTGPGPSVGKAPISSHDSQIASPTTRTKHQEDDDAFAKFYTNLTTGTMSRLTSALAYAGLPLTVEEPVPDQSRQRLEKSTVRASTDPDVKKLFSKAALDAIEDEHRQRGAQGHAFGPAESFYVVQKGGGTHLYADIAKLQQQQQRPAPNDDEEEEVFVDARDARDPPSPKHSRHSSQSAAGGRSAFGQTRTHEELELENTTLKQTLEQLATRLTEFETHAQDASMAALTQSMASLHHGAAGAGPPESRIDRRKEEERLRQLEKQLEHMTGEKEKYHGLALKQDKTLKQYKAKWDEIKKSAREKDSKRRERSEKAGEDGSIIASEVQ